MTKSDTYSAQGALDRRIVAALQVNVRASFGAIAATLGEQERTVARHCERLFSRGTVHPTVFVDELRLGIGQPTALRVSIEPGALDTVAQSLSTRSDTRAVFAVTGSMDISCELVSDNTAKLHELLSAELPAIPGIRSTRSHAVLRHVKPVAAWRVPGLTADQSAALAPAPGPARGSGTGITLSDGEHRLVSALQLNARASYTELAEQLGVHAATARRWLDRILSSGAVSLRAAVEPSWLGLPVEADVWLNVRPHALEEVSQRLAERPEVTYCGVVAGTFAVELLLALPDRRALYTFLTEVVGAEADIVDSEPTLVTRAYKRGYLTVPPPDGDTQAQS